MAPALGWPRPFKASSLLEATGHPHSCPTPSSHPNTTWPGVWYTGVNLLFGEINPSQDYLRKPLPPGTQSPGCILSFQLEAVGGRAQEWRSRLPSPQGPSGHCCCMSRGSQAELVRRQAQAGLGEQWPDGCTWLRQAPGPALWLLPAPGQVCRLPGQLSLEFFHQLGMGVSYSPCSHLPLYLQSRRPQGGAEAGSLPFFPEPPWISVCHMDHQNRALA